MYRSVLKNGIVCSLKRLSPKTTVETPIFFTQARLVNKNGSVKMVSTSELRNNDIIEVYAGEIIPCDGKIIGGFAAIDESSITGESAPVIKEADEDFSNVISGTKVISNAIKIRVTVYSDSSFMDKITRLVDAIMRKKITMN